MTNVARIWKRASLRQEDRLPCSTYDEAIARLVVHRCDHRIPDEAYNLVVGMVADIWWKTDLQVRTDVLKACRKLWGDKWS